MILLIDNFDSFVYNLARYLEELGHDCEVVRNDAITPGEIRERSPDALVLSPGPCAPEGAGVCIEAVRQLGSEIPILGVCLGHQAIAAACDALIIRVEPCHGKASRILHDGEGLFEEYAYGIDSQQRSCSIEGDDHTNMLEFFKRHFEELVRGGFEELPDGFLAGRYHSLAVSEEDLPVELEVCARTEDGIVMAIRHRQHKVWGIQFHPESVLTEHGHALLSGFLRLAGLERPQPVQETA